MSINYAKYDITIDSSGLICDFGLSWVDIVEIQTDFSGYSGDIEIAIIRNDVRSESDVDISLFYAVDVGEAESWMSYDPRPVWTTPYGPVVENGTAEFDITYAQYEQDSLNEMYNIGTFEDMVSKGVQNVSTVAAASSVKAENLMNFKKAKVPGVSLSSVSVFEGEKSISAGISISTSMVTSTTDDGGY